jgi:hypothetical protein
MGGTSAFDRSPASIFGVTLFPKFHHIRKTGILSPYGTLIPVYTTTTVQRVEGSSGRGAWAEPLGVTPVAVV